MMYESILGNSELSPPNKNSPAMSLTNDDSDIRRKDEVFTLIDEMKPQVYQYEEINQTRCISLSTFQLVEDLALEAISCL